MVVLLGPDGLHAVLHPLGLEDQFDAPVPRRPDAGFQAVVDPCIAGFSRQHLLPSREHAIDDAVVEGHGIGVPAPPAAVGILRRKHILHAPAGGVAVNAVAGQLEDIRKVLHLRVDIGVVERREPVARLERGFHRIGVEFGRDIEVFGPAAVGVLVGHDVVGDLAELVGLIAFVSLFAVLLVPVVHGIGEAFGRNLRLRLGGGGKGRNTED